MLAGLLPQSRSAVECAETKVAASEERAHPQFTGQRERLAVAGLGRADVQRIGPGGDLAEEAQGICLVAPLAALASQREGAFCERQGLRQPVGKQIRLGHQRDGQRVIEDRGPDLEES